MIVDSADRSAVLGTRIAAATSASGLRLSTPSGVLAVAVLHRSAVRTNSQREFAFALAAVQRARLCPGQGLGSAHGLPRDPVPGSARHQRRPRRSTVAWCPARPTMLEVARNVSPRKSPRCRVATRIPGRTGSAGDDDPRWLRGHGGVAGPANRPCRDVNCPLGIT